MAPTHTAVAAASAVDSFVLDVELSDRTAALLVAIEPGRNSERIARELRGKLREERLSREAAGLNHWSEHAPKFLGAVVRHARGEKRRRCREAETLYRTKHREIVRFARAIVGDVNAAEIVASNTYLELIEGKVAVPGFFTALVCNSRDYLKGEACRREKMAPQQEAFSPRFGSAEDMDGSEGKIPPFEPVSRHLEDRDPLDILIAREAETSRQNRIKAAMSDPRWRYIKRREWAAPLL